MKFKTNLQLFLTMLKIGLFTFGGGYAMIALLENEFVTKRGWLEQEEFLDVAAIAESTPGPIAINAATFVGYRAAGVIGSACATFGVVLPSFVIILVISTVLRQFQAIPAVQYAFWGIRAGVLAMLLKSLYTMFKKSVKNWVGYVAMAAAFILTALLDVHILIIIGSCAVFGLVTALLAERRAAK